MQNQITLAEVKQAFDQWRASKINRWERTPKHLRKQIQEIALYYPRRQIIASLAITEYQMNRYVGNNKVKGSVVRTFHDVPSNEFIELPIPELPKEKSASPIYLRLISTQFYKTFCKFTLIPIARPRKHCVSIGLVFVNIDTF